ncbi:MAG: hypothetical protein JWM99_942, partial [Verrucomicrobiales bacterium]|nr:hypothetical protein [Verrucomicrobiales bacterium]
RAPNSSEFPEPFDLARVKVFPLAQRKSLSRVEDILVSLDSEPVECAPEVMATVRGCAHAIREARRRNASVMLIYGAHLLRNGSALLIDKMLSDGWLTHLATNGAGTIHDWEFAFSGVSTESVEDNVATGTFGTWDETSRNIHLALLAGGLAGYGYGRALGAFVEQDGVLLPAVSELESQLRMEPSNPFSPARADLLLAMRQHGIKGGRIDVSHPWRRASIVASAFRHSIPLTVHPGIGYDIISNHPMFNGAVIGRAAGVDFRLFASAVERVDAGVVLSIGSAIMGPQVFEKTISCVNNVRIQEGREIVSGHKIFVVDLQDGGGWDWSKGEPPKTNPAYYLRFCKSFSRMGGAMHYCQSDNLRFIQRLAWELRG